MSHYLLPPKRRPHHPVRTTSSKKRKVTHTSTPSCTKTSTTSRVTTPTSSSPQALSEDQIIHRIAVAVTQAFRDQTSSQASSVTPSPSVRAVDQHQLDSTPLVQQSLTEAIQQITGADQATETETSNDSTTSKSQFVSVAAAWVPQSLLRLRIRSRVMNLLTWVCS